MAQQRSITRRRLLAASAASSVLALDARSYARVYGAMGRLNVAYIGVGGIGAGQHIGQLANLGAGCPAYADADSKRWGAAAERWSDAKGYTDYRKMFDKHAREFDAVMVGTPDHSHYPATVLAMHHGKLAEVPYPIIPGHVSVGRIAEMNGAVTGLRARGGFDVDLAWSNGRLTRVEIRSRLGWPLRIRYRAREVSVETRPDGTYVFGPELTSR